MIEVEEKYMARCIELAKGGRGNVSPNPMVGAVVVHKGRIIGEGFHRKCGEAHAEVNAIASVKDESLLKDSTIYVSLEPCSHYGKTPPCAELIIRKGIPRVVVGCLDPFPEVSGRDGGRSPCVEQGVYDATNERPSLYYLEMGAERGWVYRSFAYGRVGAGHGFVFSGDFPLGA